MFCMKNSIFFFIKSHTWEIEILNFKKIYKLIFKTHIEIFVSRPKSQFKQQEVFQNDFRIKTIRFSKPNFSKKERKHNYS